MKKIKKIFRIMLEGQRSTDIEFIKDENDVDENRISIKTAHIWL